MSESQAVAVDTGTTSREFELVLTATQLERVREWTLQEDGVERFAYMYCEPTENRLLVREIDPIPAEDCAVMESSAVRPELSIERERLGDAMSDGLVPIMVHSHPFSQNPGFSALDDNIMESYRDWLGQLYPEVPLGFIVIGHAGVDTAIYTDPSTPRREKLPISVVGEWMLETPLDAPKVERDRSIDGERYDRSIRALTDTGQKQIANTRVGIVGLGGLGSMVALQLARFGIQDFVFADPDVVERSNLPRIYGATNSDVGRQKVNVVGEQVARANPEATVEAYPARVQNVPESDLSNCDVIIGAVDRLDARLYCNEFAIRHLRYYIDGGVAIETDDSGRVTDERGLIQLVAPGANACLDCMGRNDAEHLRIEEMSEEEIEADIQRGYLEEDVVAPEPAITPLNGQAASLITRQFTKLVTDYSPPADFIRFDGLDDELVAVGTHPSEGCISCSAGADLAAGERSFDRKDLVGGDGEIEVDFTDPMDAPGADSADSQTIDQSVVDQSVGEETGVSEGTGYASQPAPEPEPKPKVRGKAVSSQENESGEKELDVPEPEHGSSDRSLAGALFTATQRAVRERAEPLTLLFLIAVVLKVLRGRR